MYQHGVRITHENNEGAVTSRWMSVSETERLVVSFARGDVRTGIAMIVGPNPPRPLDIETAERLLDEYKILDNLEIEQMSGKFVR